MSQLDPLNLAPNVPSNNKQTPLDQMVVYLKKNYGLEIDERRRKMLASRLQKRFHEKGYKSLEQYAEYLMCGGGLREELSELLNATTTRTTSFFREDRHFIFLKDKILPEFKAKYLNQPFSLRAWSAAGSTGQEAYTLAMVLDSQKYIQKLNMHYQITVSDISQKALTRIRQATYDTNAIAQIPEDMRERYLLVSKSPVNPKYRIVPELRNHVELKTNNLAASSYEHIPKSLDLIMLRNVLIYFDHPTQHDVLRKVMKHLKPDGYLMIGHSESIPDYRNLGLKSVSPAIFQIEN